tara:strand:+ start:2060 stop:3085 length:1026 start_codon:yes stop_codon:yes gene_type:complete
MQGLPQSVRIIYGPTGGRYAMMYGIAVALERKLLELGVSVLDRVGISGGALVATSMSGKEDFEAWISRCISLTKNLRIGKWQIPQNLFNLCVHGGLLNSSKTLETVFDKLFAAPPTEDCYAISWSKSAKQSVAFPLKNSPHFAKYLLASAAMPIVFSPVKINKSELPPSVAEALLLAEGEEATFQDGGLSGIFPADLIDGKKVPTIMVFIDQIPLTLKELNQKPHDLWDRLFGLRNKANRVAVSARRKTNIQLFIVPQLESFERYRLNFQLDLETAMLMYNHGKVMTEQSFNLYLSLPEQLDEQDSDRESDAEQSFSIEHTLPEIVPSQNGEHQITQAVGE